MIVGELFEFLLGTLKQALDVGDEPGVDGCCEGRVERERPPTRIAWTPQHVGSLTILHACESDAADAPR